MRRVMRECPILPYAAKRARVTVYRAWIPAAYGVTSERKCLASFSIRFN
jgi:hypothetical protein